MASNSGARPPIQRTFSRIYEKQLWGRGSGAGSHPKHNAGYVAFVQSFLRSRDIRSVVDLGCGDWQFSHAIDWGEAQYLGLDLVPSVIEDNRSRHGSASIRFEVFTGEPHELPAADLLLVKDVLQHWSNDRIEAFLANLGRFRCALITNCIDPSGRTVNHDIADGDFRPLDLLQEPFKLEAETVYAFSKHRALPLRLFRKGGWSKRVLLVTNETASV